MADPLAPVTATDPLPLSTQTWNPILAAARDFRKRDQAIAGIRQQPGANPQALVIWVRNESGADRPARSVLALGDPVGDPVNLPTEFQNRFVFSATLIANPKDIFVILIDGVADGAIGPACYMGAALADVFVNDPAHKFVVPVVGVSSYLETAVSGPAQIAWIES